MEEESINLLAFKSGLVGTAGIEFITAKAVETLSKGRPLSTKILDFWLNFLIAQNVHSADRSKILVYSSAVYASLEVKMKTVTTTGFQYPSSWTATKDFFLKDYIFVPIHQGNHYVLAIICFPGLIGKGTKTWKAEEFQNYEKRLMMAKVKSCMILVLDSKVGTVNETIIKNTLWGFISTYWKAQYEASVEVNDQNCPVIYPPVPQQGHDNNCGVFVLQFFEEFFATPFFPRELPIKNLEDWFPKSKVLTKRQDIYNKIKKGIDDTHPELRDDMPFFVPC